MILHVGATTVGNTWASWTSCDGSSAIECMGDDYVAYRTKSCTGFGDSCYQSGNSYQTTFIGLLITHLLYQIKVL